MIQSFFDQGSADIFHRRHSKAARKACPETIWPVARRKLDMLAAAVSLRSLGFPPGNELEALHGNRKGQHSIRINQKYRVCFKWTDAGPDRVEVTDYH